MDRFIARENIDLYLEKLRDPHLGDEDCAVISRMLSDQTDVLAHDLGHLGFAEDRAERWRRYVRQVRTLHDVAKSAEGRCETARLIATAEATQRLLDGFCERIRNRARRV
jgi:hypothetical protein